MTSSKPTDELLHALQDVGLGLWMLDNIDPAKWRCILYDPTSPLNRWEGNAETPAGAILAALSAAGIEARDDEKESDDAHYLRELSSRLFHYGTPNSGTDQGDVERLTEIADRI